MRSDHADLHDLVLGALSVDEGWPTGDEARGRGARSDLLWPDGLSRRIREEVAAREHKTQLELLTDRADEREAQFEQARLFTEQARDELLAALRRRLSLRPG